VRQDISSGASASVWLSIDENGRLRNFDYSPSKDDALASREFAAVLWGGLFAGALDLTQAFVGFGLLGTPPYRILQHIAGGLVGARSYQMGWPSAALGLALHFTIAFTAAIVYFGLSRKIQVLNEHSILSGLLYGEAVFIFMYFVVIPLSALGPAQFSIATYVTGPIGHPLLVGLPITLSVRRFTCVQ
jgi:hypothetical protein